MNVNLDTIKLTARQLPSKAKGLVDTVGTFSIDKTKAAVKYVKDNVKINKPETDAFKTVAQHAEEAKETVVSSNAANSVKNFAKSVADNEKVQSVVEFVKSHAKSVADNEKVQSVIKLLKDNKQTVAGAAVIVAAVAVLTAIINKISSSQSKQDNTMYYHRG